MGNIFYTSRPSEEQITQVNQQVFANPAVQQAIKDFYADPWAGGAPSYRGQTPPALKKLSDTLRAAGMPGNMRMDLDKDGKTVSIVDSSGMNWGNIIALGLMGAGAGYGLAGALASGAAPTAAGIEASATGIGAGGVPGLAAVSAPAIAGVSAPAVVTTAAGAAAPGIADRILDAAGNVAPILGEAAGAAQDENANRDLNILRREGNQLNRDKFALDAPTTRMSQSARASILGSVAPTRTTWGGPGSGLRGEIPTTTGGPGGSLPRLRSDLEPLTTEILRKNLADQLAGKDGTMTGMEDYGQESAGDKILGAGALGTSILGALRPRPRR